MVLRSLVGVACALSVAACVSAPSAAPRGSFAVEAQSAMLRLEAEGFSGSVLVACDDRVIFRQTHEASVPAELSPSYWVASITKQFTAAAILALEEDGRLALANPIDRFFPGAPADKGAITLMELLTHHSGLPQAYAADGETDREAAVAAILAVELSNPPGSAFGYSNDGYTLLAAIVEIASGQSYETYLADRLFLPAGLGDTAFWPDADAATPSVREPVTGPAGAANWGFRGATGVRASVDDLHRWVRALDNGRVLSSASVDQLFGPHVVVREGLEVGFNWFWSTSETGAPLMWSSGYEDFGGNAVIYRRRDTPLIIVAATNAGPAESRGPGWSRNARDEMLRIFAAPSASACAK